MFLKQRINLSTKKAQTFGARTNMAHIRHSQFYFTLLHPYFDHGIS